MAVVVVLGALGGRLAGPSDDRGDTASTGPGVPSGAPAAPVGPDAEPPVTLDAPGLERAIASGDLDGRVVVVNGRVAASGCEPATGCDYSLVGMPGQPLTLADDLVTRMPTASPFDERAVRPYAFRVRDDGVLVLLGVVGEGLDRPVPADQLGADMLIGSLAIATGWLTSSAIDSSAAPCTLPRISPPECSAARSYALSGVEVPADATLEPERSLQVEIAPDARRGLFRPSGHGRFLIRETPGLWRVEGRYAAIVPQVDPVAPSPGDDLSLDQLRAGIADGSLTGRVIVIDGVLPMVQVPCLRLSDCHAWMPQVPGVRIAENHGSDASITNDMPEGPHVLVGDGVGLTYLGTMAGSTDTPMTAERLAALSPGGADTDVRLVEGVVGPVPCFGCPRSPGPSSEQWLSGVAASGTGSVPVRVPDTIEPPSDVDRYLVRATIRPPCAGVTEPSDPSCEGVGRYEWSLVAAVGDEPILRVALP